MKNGAAYAKKLKSGYRKIKGSADTKPTDDNVDPIEQLIVAVFAEEVGVKRGRKAFAALQEAMVDYNELRVSSPGEVVEAVGSHVVKAVKLAKTLLRILNAVFQREYAVSLDSLQGKGVRDTRAYIDTLDGMTSYVSAAIRQWSYGAHAIPVSHPALLWLRDEQWIGPESETAEVQSFLERHVSAADGRQFCLDLDFQAANRAPAKAKPAAKPAAKATKTKTTRSAKSTAKSRSAKPRASASKSAKSTTRGKKSTRKTTENRRKKKVSSRSGR